MSTTGTCGTVDCMTTTPSKTTTAYTVQAILSFGIALAAGAPMPE